MSRFSKKSHRLRNEQGKNDQEPQREEDHDLVHPTHSGSGRHGAGHRRRAHRTGSARLGKGLGADGAVEAGERRIAVDAALEIFRPVGRRRLRQADRRLHGRRPASRSRSRANPTKTCSPRPPSPPTPAPVPTCSGAFIRCRICSRKMRRRHRRRRLSRQEIRRLGRLGVKYGKSGDKWIAVPICYSGNLMNYRVSHMQKAGFSKFPATTDEFLEYAKATKKNGNAGRLRARPRFRRRQWLDATGACGRMAASRRQERQGGHQFAGDREGARITPRRSSTTWCRASPRGTTPSTTRRSWPARSPWTNNGISIYVAANNDPTKKEIAEDMNHAYMAGGPGRQADRTASHVSDPGDDPHQVSAGVQGADRLHAGSRSSSIRGSRPPKGYLTHCLNAYDANPVWTVRSQAYGLSRRRQALADRRRRGFGRREGGDRDRRLRRCSTCSPSFCTGREDAKSAMRIAERPALAHLSGVVRRIRD